MRCTLVFPVHERPKIFTNAHICLIITDITNIGTSTKEQRSKLWREIMKCTIKDIADSLHLSRNTVAKVLNHKEGVSEKTKRLVLSKAQEMNYRAMVNEGNGLVHSENPDTILFLTRGSVNYSGFWIQVMKGIESIISKKNYTLSLAMMDDEDIHSLRFPAILQNPSVKGVVLVELCDPRVCDAVIRYGLPTVTIDMPKNYSNLSERIDIVTMENRIHIQQIVERLISKGYKSFAFAGDIFTNNVGRGFQERYEALCETLKAHDLKLDADASLLHDTDQQLMNISYIVDVLKKLPSLPQVYICGNDWTAIQMMHAVQFLGYSVPKDISIIGFDNIDESNNTLPPLTTISTPKLELGKAAADCLLNRIDQPNLPHVFIQYMTTLVIRESADL
jgi:LacI family transcriptional regulator